MRLCVFALSEGDGGDSGRLDELKKTYSVNDMYPSRRPQRDYVLVVLPRHFLIIIFLDSRHRGAGDSARAEQ